MNDVSNAKAVMRREVLSRVAALPASVRAAGSDAICRRIVSSPWWAGARLTMVYMPFGAEVDVGPLAAAKLAAGMRICVPAFEVPTATMWAVPMPEWLPASWAKGRMGVPVAPVGPRIDPAEIDLVIVPGVAFDSKGNRLGRGMGFYDRFLNDPGLKAVAVGMAFDEQLVEHVPHGSTDAVLHAVATASAMMLSKKAPIRGGLDLRVH